MSNSRPISYMVADVNESFRYLYHSTSSLQVEFNNITNMPTALLLLTCKIFRWKLEHHFSSNKIHPQVSVIKMHPVALVLEVRYVFWAQKD